MDQLAELMVLEPPSYACDLCIREEPCAQQQSGLTCRSGIKARLLKMKDEFEPGLETELQRQFAFLDCLRATGATNMYGAAPYLQKEFPRWSQDWYQSVLKLWMECFPKEDATAHDT